MLLGSLHNHTVWSDGKTGVEEMVESARKLGLAELGISDHYTMIPSREQLDWSMPLDRLGDYAENVRSAGSRTIDLAVLLGIEADFFPETVEELRGSLALRPFDYVIGSVHFLNDFSVDSDPSDWESLSVEEVDDKWRLYWLRIRQMAESRVFDVAAHLDLPKKFGFRPKSDMRASEQAALDAIKTADMAIEINTNGWNLPAREAYPSLPLLQEARTRGIPLLINADAHHPDHLTRHFERAADLARQAGYSELVRFDQRRRSVYAL